jgi:FkbM family methyltransferase
MSVIRTAAEHMARGRVFRRHIDVAGRRMPIHITPDAQLKYMKPGSTAFDQDLVQLAIDRLRPDSIVWDIGANVGTFTVAAAAIAEPGRVIAIEADVWLAEILYRTAAEAVYRGRIEVLPCAVSSATGIASFHIAKRGRASNALAEAGGRSVMGGVRQSRLVPTLTCDELLRHLPAPALVKIDVEGAEVMVLEGAARLLAEARPAIYIESGAETAPGVRRILEGAGYELANPEPGPEPGSVLPFNSLFLHPLK